MNTQVDDSFRRARSLLIALRALLECATIVEQNSDQIAGCIFMLTELEEAIRAMEAVPRPVNDA